MASQSEEHPSAISAIVSDTLQVTPHFNLTHPDYSLQTLDALELDRKIALLIAGTPLPYLINKQAFFGLDFYVNNNVLIPRPETEQLVTLAHKWMNSKSQKLRVIEIGTGSGCIAIAISHHMKNTFFIAADLSFNALQVAKTNVIEHKLMDRIALVQMESLNGIDGQFDCIIANPPYIPSKRLINLPVARHEPLIALDGGEDGFRIIEKIIIQSKNLIKRGGLILIEIDESHATIAKKTSKMHFPLSSIRIETDYAEKTRFLMLQTE